ncbi:hypothetical protein XELAEV_18009784mg [Xenopus laevis]|uniref:Reverse transcriptase domain-containing protein n=1 Tax=Xenopus laevis TaxID=8355 RepID=A0A974DU66_XENLA|nr:hypothetical protein XELAEV_18009784mg [Xenopus laevis]
MAQLEGNFLASCNTRPLTYLRYIDDILIICVHHYKKLLAFHQRFNQFHPIINLTLNHSYSHINFLDTTIYIKNGTIQKCLPKTNRHPAYLRWDSFHPLHISQTLRYNQICSNLDDGNKPIPSLRKTFRKMIVRSALPKTTKVGTFPCNSSRCETCKYILCKDQVPVPNRQKVYTIRDYYLCASSHVVYMITCTRSGIPNLLNP